MSGVRYVWRGRMKFQWATQNEMKIIVAGYPKTGTKSVNAALKQLGYEVYDFVEHMYCLEHEWDQVFKHGWDEKTFYDMYKSVDVAIDMPASLFWEPMHEAFPDAKIILSVRDSEEAWLQSFRNHFKRLDDHFLARCLQIVEFILQRKTGLLLNKVYQFGFDVDRAMFRRRTAINGPVLKMRYRAHNDRIKQIVPPGKLLVFNCKEGWEPLCKFLDVPVPETTFPHKNVNAAVIEESVVHPLGKVYQREVKISFAIFIVKLFLLILLFYYAVGRFM